MALSAFDDQSHRPGSAELAAVLGKAAPLWAKLTSAAAEEAGELTEEWKFAGRNYGWSMRLKRKDRIIVYMTPCAGHVLVGIVLGGKAIDAGRAEGLSKSVAAVVDGAMKAPEGYGIRLPVKAARDVAVVRALVRMKVA